MRQLAAAALAAVLSVGVVACGTTSSPDTPEGPSTVTEKISLPASREQVRTTAEDVIELLMDDSGPLAERAPKVRFASGTWSTCTDDADGWSYDTNGRIDLSGADGGLALLPSLGDLLQKQGWKVDESPSGADPRTTVTARKGPHLVRVRAYDDRPFLLTEVLGPCLPATSAERADLEARKGSEPLDL